MKLQQHHNRGNMWFLHSTFVLFTTLFFHRKKKLQVLKEAALKMVAKFTSKTENNGKCQRKARYQGALRLTENDI